MHDRRLHVTIVSAEDLKALRLCRLRPYAVVWIERHNRRATRVDGDGRSNPSWNECFTFDVPEHLPRHPESYLHVRIYSKGGLLGRTFLGMALIPLPEIVQQSNTTEISMYQLTRRSGKVKGAVRLSVKMDDTTAVPSGAEYGVASQPAMAYPFPNEKLGHGEQQQVYPPKQACQPHLPEGQYPPQQNYYPPLHGYHQH